MTLKRSFSTIAFLSGLSFFSICVESSVGAPLPFGLQETQVSDNGPALLKEDLPDLENASETFAESGPVVLSSGTNTPLSQQAFPLVTPGVVVVGPKKLTTPKSSTAVSKTIQSPKGPVKVIKTQTEKATPLSPTSQRETSQERFSQFSHTQEPSFVRAATQRNESEGRVIRTTLKQPPAAPQIDVEEAQARTYLRDGKHPVTPQNINAVRQLIRLTQQHNANPVPFVTDTIFLADKGLDITAGNLNALRHLTIIDPSITQIREMNAAHADKFVNYTDGDNLADANTWLAYDPAVPDPIPANLRNVTAALRNSINPIANPTAAQIREMSTAGEDRRVDFDDDDVVANANTWLAYDPAVPDPIPGNLENVTTALRYANIPIADPNAYHIYQMSQGLDNGTIGWNWDDINAANALLLEGIDPTGANIPTTRQGLEDLNANVFQDPATAIPYVYNSDNARAIAIAVNRGVAIDGPVIDSVHQMRAINVLDPTAQQITDVRHNLEVLRDPHAGINDGTAPGHNFDPADPDNVRAVTRVAALQDAVGEANVRDFTLGLVAPDVNARFINAAKKIGLNTPLFMDLDRTARRQNQGTFNLFNEIDTLNPNSPGGALITTPAGTFPLQNLLSQGGGAADNILALNYLVANTRGALPKAAVKQNYYTTVLNATKSLLQIEPNGLNSTQLEADHGIRLQTAEELEAHLRALAAAEANAAQRDALLEHADAVHLFTTTIKTND
ncbi:MAG: hypothetical protein JSS34_08035 [Proteobacteria bacterium]|nr:hypothetical protein [Pseudomonadota bacterium]